MQLLPYDEERAWLVDRLVELVARQGLGPFLSNPIVRPDSSFFPDRWSNTFEGGDRIARRLMQYAGLGDYDVEIGTFEDHGAVVEEFESQTSRHGAAGLFLGLESGVCRIALATDLVADAETIAGVLAHEVAHAYRVAHGLERPDPQEEELLTDLTAVFLGFGLLQANNSSRSRSGSGLTEGRYVHSWRVEKFGYLSGQAFAYLLAIQLAVRGADRKTRRHLRGLLEPNLATFFDAASQVVENELGSLRTLLQVPPAETRPRVTDPADLRAPLPELPELAPTVAASPEGTLWPVFRIREDRADAGTWLGLFAGVTLAGLVLALGGLDSFETTVGSVLLGSFLVASTAFGRWLGRRRVRDLCSAYDCKHVIPPDHTHCPTCGGEILATLDDPNDRLRIEEEILAERRSQGLPVPTPEPSVPGPAKLEVDGREISV